MKKPRKRSGERFTVHGGLAVKLTGRKYRVQGSHPTPGLRRNRRPRGWKP